MRQRLECWNPWSERHVQLERARDAAQTHDSGEGAEGDTGPGWHPSLETQ